MTPAERIAARLTRVHLLAAASWPYAAEVALDALCPKGERVVLDRTGDTDRLVRQARVACAEYHGGDIMRLDSGEVVHCEELPCCVPDGDVWIDSDGAS